MNSLYYEELVPIGIDEEQYETLRKYYDVFLSDLNGQNIRNIAIISNRIFEQRGRKYLKIVGLDVFTGKVVSLIDNHGKNYGLCSYNEDCAKLKSRMVIKVPVGLCENVFVQQGKNQSVKLCNVMRMKGKYEILGTTNWFELRKKYEELRNSNLAVSIDGKKTTVESAFQSSKVFENGGPYLDLFYSPSIVSKKDQRLPSSGRLMKFVLLGDEFPANPKTFFYDWLYVNAVSQNKELLTKLSEYNAFTDIAFNPEKSINCQARSAAICVSLFKKGLLSDALKNKDEFKKIVYSDENKITEGVQISFF